MRDGRQIARGFPSGLRADVDVVVAALAEPQHVLSTRTQTLSVQGEAVELPGRVYNPELSDRAIAALSETQRLIAGCVYARHHDGYVRQAACESIVAAANPWVVPYVVQLLGEYVVEIASLILGRLTEQSSFGRPEYRDFVAANEAFMQLTEQRAISTWSAYYRQDFSRTSYPALVALAKLREGAQG